MAGGDLVITGPFGQQTVITLDANGYVASIVNPGGETRRRCATRAGPAQGRDCAPRESRPSRAVSPAQVLVFNLSVTSQTDTVSVNTRTVTRTYNSATRTYTDTTPEGRQTLTTLDTKGRVRKTQLAGVHPTRQEYDAKGRVIRVKEGPDPDTAATRVTEFDYVDVIDIAFGYPQESEGQLKSVTDPLGRTVTFEYDEDVRVSKQILPDDREIGFDYDNAGNVTQVIPPGRPPHDFTYTQTNLEQTYDPPQVTPPLATVTTTTTYTGDGQVDLITRPDGKQIDFAYDQAGRVDAITLQPSGEARDYGYDLTTGHLTQIAGADAALTFTYDGSLQTTETWSGPEVATASVTRSYDDSFRVQSLQVNQETPIDYVYDDDDLLIQAGNLTLTRNPTNGLLTGTSITEGAGTIADTYEYDAFGQLEHYEARHNGTEILDFEYTRDDLGRIESIVETKNTTGTPTTKETHYRYDPAGRLYRVCPDANCATVASEYHYDANGNRIAGSFNSQGTITSAVYDDQDRLLELTQGPTTTTYTYTDNGELLTKTDPSGTTTYDYDLLGNLRTVTPPSGPEIEYLIDARNRRTGKKVGGVLEKQWIYQVQLEPVAELDGAGNLISEFVYAAKSNVPSFIIRHDDPAPGQTTTYQVVSDHLGSVRVVAGIDAVNAVIAEELEYDEFGITSSNLSFQPLGFAGGFHDAELELVRLGARDLNPTVGRWVLKDPLRLRGGTANLFEYAGSDPINNVDVSGLFSLSLTGTTAAIGAVIGSISGLAQGLNSGEGGFGLFSAAAGGAVGGAVAGGLGTLSISQAVLATGLSGFLAGPSGAVAGQAIVNLLNGDPSLCGLDSGVLLNSAVFGLVGGIVGGASALWGADTAMQIVVAGWGASLEFFANAGARPDSLTDPCP